MKTEKIIFTSILIAVGIFVVFLFFFTITGLGSGFQDGYILKTQMVGDGAVNPSQQEHRDVAHTMIVVGSLVFGLMGGVIFLGLKINDRIN